MTISTYQSTKGNNSIIMLSVSFNGYRLRLSSGVSTAKENYHKKKFVTDNDNDANYKRQKIKNLITDIYRIENEYEAANGSGSLNEEILKSKLKEFKPTKSEIKQMKVKKANESFSAAFNNFLTGIKSGTILNNRNDKYSKSSTHLFTYTLESLKKFAEKKRYELTFESINSTFYSQYTNYLYEVGKSNNTVSIYLSLLKIFMKYAYELNYHRNTSYTNFKKNPKQSDLIALTSSELVTLRKMKFGNSSLQNARDLFLLQCYTGLRYSDLRNLKTENIDLENREIKLTTVKTNEIIRVPILKAAYDLVADYIDGNITVMSKELQNKNIKEVCKLAGINTPTSIVKYISGNRAEITKPKHELISTHTARRTFITLSLQKNILPEIIMKVTGHKSRASFQKYVRFSEKDVKSAFEGLEL